MSGRGAGYLGGGPSGSFLHGHAMLGQCASPFHTSFLPLCAAPCRYASGQGYTKLLSTLGSDIVQLLKNLNDLHLHLSSGQPAMEAPAFRVENVRAAEL